MKDMKSSLERKNIIPLKIIVYLNTKIEKIARILLFSILSVIVGSCGTTNNQCIDIDINDSGIFANSVKVDLPTSLSNIKGIFGEPTNVIIQSHIEISEAKKKFGAIPNNIYKYNNYGILVYQRAGQDNINSISIYFEKPHSSLKLLDVFSGKLKLFGVAITNNTSFDDLKTIPEIKISESNFKVCLATSPDYDLTFEFQNNQNKNKLIGFSVEAKNDSEKTNEMGWSENDIEIFKVAISGVKEIKQLCSQNDVNISDFTECYTNRVATTITLYEVQNPTTKTQPKFAKIMQECIFQYTKK